MSGQALIDSVTANIDKALDAKQEIQDAELPQEASIEPDQIDSSQNNRTSTTNNVIGAIEIDSSSNQIDSSAEGTKRMSELKVESAISMDINISAKKQEKR